jgi:holo-[acyl-carrier protein] synthase
MAAKVETTIENHPEVAVAGAGSERTELMRQMTDMCERAGPTLGEGARIGLDLVSVDDVADSLLQFGERYVERIFTPHERACCGWPTSFAPPEAGGRYGDGRSLEMLAARFAAKEATVKVLRPTGAIPPWRDIEVRRAPDGWCTLWLDGAAADLAAQQGIHHLAVSLTHHGGYAAAVVMAVCNGELREKGEEAWS